MTTYRVMVPEFQWGGQRLEPGDIIEAENTQEIITNLALGRLAVAATEPDPPVAPVPPMPPRVASATGVAIGGEKVPASAPMTTADMPTARKRRFPRRDTPIGES